MALMGRFNQDFLKSKSLPVSGKKGDLMDRIADWIDNH
jgi:ATP-dependent DNA helicase 2 subunit 1